MARLALALALLLALPGAGAAWRAAGGLEPDTPWDEPSLMYPDARPGQNVYFQAFVAAPQTSHNPNVGLLGSRVLPAPALHHRAILGVWNDCNRDGYIGLAESAVTDYAASLLLDESLCPAMPDASGPVHNDGRWVNELLSIGMVDPCEYESSASARQSCGVDAWAPNERVHYVNGTYVWGDVGHPGQVPRAECILAPLPDGTTGSTGGLIAWSDCQSRRGVVRAVNEADKDGSLGLRFENGTSPEESSSPLNQRFPVTLFGANGRPGLLQGDTEHASARAWDCSAAPLAEANDPHGYRELALVDPTGQLHAERFPLVIAYAVTGVGFVDEDRDPATPGVLRRPLTDEDGTYARIPALSPGLLDPTASWWRTLEHAADGPAGDCDDGTESALARAYLGGHVESDARPILEARKDRTSLTFTFFDGHRGLHPNLDPATGPTFSSDGGTMLLDHGGPPPFGRGGDGPIWSATMQSEQDAQLLNRDDLEPMPALHFTYYVALGPDASRFTPPSWNERVYGAEHCEGKTSGIHRGWVCDASLWWRDAEGRSNVPTYAQGQRIGRVPGDVYHMRDVDCYDGELARGSGVHVSLIYLRAEGGCA